jgi:hypothetical protein
MYGQLSLPFNVIPGSPGGNDIALANGVRISAVTIAIAKRDVIMTSSF